MPLTEDFTYRLDTGPVLNADTASLPFVDITKITGLDSAPFRETIRDHEGTDGGFIDAEFENGREIVLDGTVYASASSAESYLDTLKSNFAPVTSPIPFYILNPGVVERLIYVKPRGARYDVDTARRLGITNIQFGLYAEDPRIYAATESLTTIPFGAEAITGFGFTNILDTFTRTVAAGSWGSTDTSQVWAVSGGTVGTDYFVNGTKGVQSNGTVNVLRHSFLDSGQTDFDIYVSVTCPVVPTGAAITLWAVGRFLDTSNYYVAQISIATSGTASLSIQKRVAGVLSTVVSGVSVGTHSAGDTWRIHFKGSGTRLEASAWKPASASEPISFTLSGTDTSLTTGTNIGLLSRLESGNTNTLPVEIAWDNLQVVLGLGFDFGFGGTAVGADGAFVNNLGNRPTPPTFTIFGPVNTPIIIDDTFGHTLQFNIILSASETLVVNALNRTVLLNGTTNRRNVLVDGDWFFLNTGQTFLRYHAISGATSFMEVRFRSAWR